MNPSSATIAPSAIRPILTLARHGVVDAIRSRLLWILLALIALASCVGLFGGELALTEQRQVAASAAAPLLRIAAVLLVAMIVTTGVVREFADRTVLLVLAAPMPRSHWSLGRLAGGSAVALIVALACGLPLLALAPPVAVFAWTLSLVSELAIVVALALACASAVRQVTAALMAVLAFYALSRLIGVILMLDQHAPVAAGSVVGTIGSGLIQALGYLLPRLDLFTRTDWLLDGPSALALPLAQAPIYIVVLAAIAVIDLGRHDV